MWICDTENDVETPFYHWLTLRQNFYRTVLNFLNFLQGKSNEKMSVVLHFLTCSSQKIEKEK